MGTDDHIEVSIGVDVGQHGPRAGQASVVEPRYLPAIKRSIQHTLPDHLTRGRYMRQQQGKQDSRSKDLCVSHGTHLLKGASGGRSLRRERRLRHEPCAAVRTDLLQATIGAAAPGSPYHGVFRAAGRLALPFAFLPGGQTAKAAPPFAAAVRLSSGDRRPPSPLQETTPVGQMRTRACASGASVPPALVRAGTDLKVPSEIA